MRPRSHATVKIPVAGAGGWHTLRFSEGRAKPCNRLKPLAKSSAADHPIPGRPSDVVARAISNQLFPSPKTNSFRGQTDYSRVIPSARGQLRHALRGTLSACHPTIRPVFLV